MKTSLPLSIFLLKFLFSFGNPNFGNSLSPMFHNIFPHYINSTCRLHLVFEKITSESLEHTGNLPISLKSRKYYIETSNFRFIKDEGHPTLNIFRNKGWQCENVFFLFEPTEVLNEKYVDVLSTWIKLNNYVYLVDFSDGVGTDSKWGTESIWFFVISNLKKEEFSILPRMWETNDYEKQAIIKLFTVNLFLLFLSNGNNSLSFCTLYTLHGWNLHCSPTFNVESLQSNELYKLGPDNIWEIEDSTTIHGIPFSSNFTNAEGYILKNILERKMNGSILTTGCGLYSHCLYSKFVSVNPLNELGGFRDPIFLKTEGLNYLSCYRVTFINFYLYLAPFSVTIWVCILVVLVLSGLFIDCICYVQNLQMRMSMMLIFLGFLIDEASFIPKKLWNRTFSKMVIVPWLLFGSILSHLYLSKLIDDVNSPLAGNRLKFLNETRIETDDEVDITKANL